MLKELRKQDKAVREQYAFWAAFAVTLVIAIIWFISVAIDLRGAALPKTTLETASSSDQNIQGAFSQFFEDIFSEVKGSWDDLQTKTQDTEVATTSNATTTNEILISTSTPASTQSNTKQTVKISTSSDRITE